MKSVLVTNASSTTALAVIRSLGRRGIPVIAADSVASSVGFMSKYCMTRLLYDDPLERPSKSLATLVEIGKRFKKPILLPAGDDIIFLAMKYRAAIDKAFILPLPPTTSLKFAFDKSLTMQLASKMGIPIPRTFMPSDLKELEGSKEDLRFPVVIKPRINVGFRRRFGAKILKAWSFKQLSERYRTVSKYFSKPLIQEYIPGGTKTLYSLCTIFDAAHRSLGLFTMRKLQQLMEGVTACGESVSNLRVESFGIELLRAMKWVGPVEVEFKKDSRDGEFKLMEVNPRPFMWVSLPIKSGFDMPFLWYKIALEGTCFKTCDMRKDLKFINLMHYFLGFINELSSNTLEVEGLRNYLTNLKGRFVFDLLSKDDISPFLCYPFLFLILRAVEATSKISFQASNLTHV